MRFGIEARFFLKGQYNCTVFKGDVDGDKQLYRGTLKVMV